MPYTAMPTEEPGIDYPSAAKLTPIQTIPSGGVDLTGELKELAQALHFHPYEVLAVARKAGRRRLNRPWFNGLGEEVAQNQVMRNAFGSTPLTLLLEG